MKEHNYVAVLDLSDASGLTNLAEGHSMVLEYQKKIDDAWKERIETASRREQESFKNRLASWKEHYESNRRRYQREFKESKTKEHGLLIVSFGLGSLYLVGFCYSLLLLGTRYGGLCMLTYLLTGAAGLGTVVNRRRSIIQVQKRLQTKIDVILLEPISFQWPEPPAASVVSRWWSQIRIPAFFWERQCQEKPSEKYENFGISGEHEMIRKLVPWPSDKSDFVLILHSVLIDRNLDADLVVLAPAVSFYSNASIGRGR